MFDHVCSLFGTMKFLFDDMLVTGGSNGLWYPLLFGMLAGAGSGLGTMRREPLKSQDIQQREDAPAIQHNDALRETPNVEVRRLAGRSSGLKRQLQPSLLVFPRVRLAALAGARSSTVRLTMGATTMINRKILLAVAAVAMGTTGAAWADDGEHHICAIPDSVVDNIQKQLGVVVARPDANGGIFKPNRMWAAVVDRTGHLCSVTKTGDAWPGSRAIAIAKAETGNDFSNDALALSTANLYAPTQPGGSLYGLNNSNPFNADFLAQGSGHGKVVGGIITFGGGVALYQNGKVIGGLGVSGDSSCADHAIAFRMRALAALDKVPGGVAPDGTDNIIYAPAGTAPTGFEQPHCFPSDLTPTQIEH